MKISKESWVIAAIGTTDLLTTILFIRHHDAMEANPLFQFLWEMGIPFFVAAKMALLVGPLCLIEWARRRKPRFVRMALRGGIAAYVGLYSIGVARLNQQPAGASEMSLQVTLTLPGVKPEVVRQQLVDLRKTNHYKRYRGRWARETGNGSFVVPVFENGMGTILPRVASVR